MNLRQYSFIDRCLIHLNQTLQTMGNKAVSQRAHPDANLAEPTLSATEQRCSQGLMRVNHTGEISAQALYHAQALTARTAQVKDSMKQAALEENDHLAWCQQRLQELNSHPSYLNPFWYGGSFLIGLLAGWAGDAWNLGFVAETERQVVNHLEQHLQQLPNGDLKSKAILEQMREDEAHHATVAITAGAMELPAMIKLLMRYFSKVMTTTAYWL